MLAGHTCLIPTNTTDIKTKFTFTEEEIPEIKDFDYDKSGMITKAESDVVGTTFQFFHLTLAEFLSAVHIIFNKEIDVFSLGSDVITSFWFGLQGGLIDNSASPRIINKFINALGVKPIPQSHILDSFVGLKNEVMKRNESNRWDG